MILQLLVFFSPGVSAGAFILITVSSKWNDLLGGECRRAAVSPIIVAVGPVIDGVTPTVPLERLAGLDAVDQEGVWVPLTPSSTHDTLYSDGFHPVLQSVSSDILRKDYRITREDDTQWGTHCTYPVSLFTLVLHKFGV